MEVLCGEGDGPDLRTLLLVERFVEATDDYLGAVRRSAFRVPILWRPIRLAVDSGGHLGVQFKHRMTGKQEGMFLASEHSRFSTVVADISIDEVDEQRLIERIVLPANGTLSESQGGAEAPDRLSP